MRCVRSGRAWSSRTPKSRRRRDSGACPSVVVQSLAGFRVLVSQAGGDMQPNQTTGWNWGFLEVRWEKRGGNQCTAGARGEEGMGWGRSGGACLPGLGRAGWLSGFWQARIGSPRACVVSCRGCCNGKRVRSRVPSTRRAFPFLDGHEDKPERDPVGLEMRDGRRGMCFSSSSIAAQSAGEGLTRRSCLSVGERMFGCSTSNVGGGRKTDRETDYKKREAR